MIKNLTLKNCVELAIATEEFGAETYARLAEKFSGIPDVASLFKRLSEDERAHRRQFQELLGKIPSETRPAESGEMKEYLEAISYSLYFFRYKGPFKDVDTIKDRDDALVTALEFEKATLAFYKAVEETEGSSEILSEVIAAERSHVVVIMKALLVEGSKFRSLQDTWP